MSKVSVERLTRRIADIPGVFVEPPREGQGALATDAILHDMVLVQSGEAPVPSFLALFRREEGAASKRASKGSKKGARVSPTQRDYLARLLAWLLMDEAFHGVSRSRLELAVKEALSVLEVVAARQFLEDADRREELVRLTLKRLTLPPEGETMADAEDRLSSLDSVRRVQLLQEARAAEEERRKRERELAAELARKQAAEQAARYDREY